MEAEAEGLLGIVASTYLVLQVTINSYDTIANNACMIHVPNHNSITFEAG